MVTYWALTYLLKMIQSYHSTPNLIKYFNISNDTSTAKVSTGFTSIRGNRIGDSCIETKFFVSSNRRTRQFTFYHDVIHTLPSQS